MGKKFDRLNVGMTHEGMAKLDELRFLLAKQTGKYGYTLNQIGAWFVHHGLSLGSDKAMLKAITIGMERERSILEGGNPGADTNGHGHESDRPYIIGGGTQRIAKPKVIRRPVDGRGGKRTHHDEAATPAADL